MKPFKLILTFLFFLYQTIAFSIEIDNAKLFIDGIGNQAIKILKIPVDDRNKRKLEFKLLLTEKFNMDLIGKAILGKDILKNSSEKQISDFVKTLEEHIVKVYTSQLGIYTGQVFSINDAMKKNKDVFVYTSIDTGNTPSIRIVWRVRENEGVPKVIDMAVEGVSLLRTKRADFKVYLDNAGLEGLINKLKEMNATPDLKIPGEK